jgi:hypothetical protein
MTAKNSFDSSFEIAEANMCLNLPPLLQPFPFLDDTDPDSRASNLPGEIAVFGSQFAYHSEFDIQFTNLSKFIGLANCFSSCVSLPFS